MSESVWKLRIIRAHYLRMGTYGPNHGIINISPDWFPYFSDYQQICWLTFPRLMREKSGGI